jgi:hypothetical protein
MEEKDLKEKDLYICEKYNCLVRGNEPVCPCQSWAVIIGSDGKEIRMGDKRKKKN